MKKRLIGSCREHYRKIYFFYCNRCLKLERSRAYSWGQFDTRRSIEAHLMAEYKKYTNKVGHAAYAQIVYNLAKQIKDKKL